MKLDWVFLDLGSTLIDESEFMEHLFRKAYESLEAEGVETTWKVFRNNLQRVIKQRSHGGGVRNILRAVVPFFTKEKETVERIVEDYTTNVNLQYLELLTLYPETAPVLRKLNKKYHLGVIANQPKGARRSLRKLGIIKYFKVIALSNELGYGKPNPKIFLHALKNAKCSPHKAVMIGDRLDTDIAPAKSIGTRTVRVKRGSTALPEPSNELETPDYEIHSLEDLPELPSSFQS